MKHQRRRKENDLIDPFQRLSTELLLKIIKLLPDFTTLRSLVMASERIESIFSGAPHEIVAAVMPSSAPNENEIYTSMIAVIAIRTGTHVCQDASQVKDWVLDMQKNKTPLSAMPVSALLLRKFVGLAHRIHVIAHACLDYYVAKCQALKPAQLADPHFRYPRLSSSWLVRPDGEETELPDLEPPTWAEEQRVLSELWKVQVFYELQMARRTGQLAWSVNALSDLKAMGVLDFYGVKAYPRERLLTVVEFIDRFRRATQVPATRTHSHCFQMPQDPAGRSVFDGVCSPKPCAQKERESSGRKREPPSRNLAWVFQRQMSSHWGSPLQGCDFSPFRHCGFAIWDNDRMIALGFSASGDQGFHAGTR